MNTIYLGKVLRQACTLGRQCLSDNTVNTSWRISRSHLLKIFILNQECSLSMRMSGHHALNLQKLTLFSKSLQSVQTCKANQQDYSTAFIIAFANLVAPKRVYSYNKTIFTKRAFNQSIIASFEPLDITWQGISIPSQSCLETVLPMAAILEYQHGKWPIVS